MMEEPETPYLVIAAANFRRFLWPQKSPKRPYVGLNIPLIWYFFRKHSTAGYPICSYSGSLAATLTDHRVLTYVAKTQAKEGETPLPPESISTHYRPIFFTAQWAFFKISTRLSSALLHIASRTVVQ